MKPRGIRAAATRWGIVAMLLAAPARAADVVIDHSVMKNAVCSNAVKRLTAVAAPARFEIKADGSLVVNEKVASPSVSFSGLGTHAVVRVDVEGAKDPVACDDAANATTYTLAAGKSEKLSVRVFDEVSGADNTARERDLVAPEIAARLAQADVAERSAARQLVRGQLTTLVVHARRLLVDPTRATVDMFPVVADDAATATKAIERQIARHPCGVSTTQLLMPSVCKELRAVGVNVALLQSMVSNAAPLADAQRASWLQTLKAGDVVESLVPAPPMADTSAYCDTMAELRALTLSGPFPPPLRLMTRTELPLIDRSHTLVARYGTNLSAIDGAPITGRWAFVVTDVPTNETVSFIAHKGKVVSDVTALIPAFVSAIVRSVQQPVVLGPSLLTHVGQTSLQWEDLQLEPVEQTGADPLTSLICPTVGFKIDAAVAPIAKHETHTYVFGPLDKSTVTDATICKGEVCTGDDNDKAAKSRVSLTPSLAGTFTILAELSFGMPFTGPAAMNTPGFQSIDGVDGPDQVFQMQQRIDIANFFSASVLGGWRFANKWIVAFGPSLLVGSTGNTFTQWNARVGFRIANGFYVTLGPSVRFLKYPDSYAVGDEVAVPRAASGQTTATPTFASHFSPELQTDIGISIDLGTIGSIASDLVKAVGGSK